MNKLIILLLLVFSLNCFAEESVYLNKDEKAPFSGFLLPKEKVEELQKQSQLLDSYKKSLDIYKLNEDLYEKNQKILLDQNQQLSEDLSKRKDLTTFTSFLMFGGGVAATGNLPTGVGIAAAGLVVWLIEKVF